MAINVTPSFQPGQVDNFDPSQTIGQFTKGAGDVVALGRNMVSRATEQIALEKLKALAPLAKEQAKQELQRKIMLDQEIQSSREQAGRAIKTESDIQGYGGERNSDVIETPNALNAAVGAAAAPQGQDPNAAINEDVYRVPLAKSDNSAAQPPAVINTAPAPAPSPINNAVSSAALAPRKAMVPINSEYRFNPNFREDERSRLSSEKHNERMQEIALKKTSNHEERMQEIALKKTEKTLRSEYDTYIDKNGKYYYVKIGTDVPDGLKKVAATGTPKAINITDGTMDENGRLNIQPHILGEPMPDGWDVVVPSMETANIRDKQKTIEINNKEIAALRKMIEGEKGLQMFPADVQAVKDKIAEIDARNRELRGEEPIPKPAPKKVEDTKSGDKTGTSHWYNPFTWGKGKPKPTEERVSVYDKNGKRGNIPKSQLQEALDSKEYTLAK